MKNVCDDIVLRACASCKEKDDTVFWERYRYMYRDRILRDSVIVRDTIRVFYPIKRSKNRYQVAKFSSMGGRIALAIALLFAAEYFTGYCCLLIICNTFATWFCKQLNYNSKYFFVRVNHLVNFVVKESMNNIG